MSQDFYIMGKSIGWVMDDETEAAATVLDGIDGLTAEQRASFVAGFQATRKERAAPQKPPQLVRYDSPEEIFNDG